MSSFSASSSAPFGLDAAYLKAESIAPDFVTEIHSDDDMLSVIARDGEVFERQRWYYFMHGREALRVVENALRSAGMEWKAIDRCLEFACGYGRFTRHLVHCLPPAKITTSDILPSAVRFVAERFGTESLLSAADPEQVDFPHSYDLIWVGSLFSHLPRPRFEAWLKKLYQQLTPRGLLIFTTHSWERCPEAWLDATGFAFARQSETQDLNLEEYGTTYVQRETMESIAASVGIAHLATRACDIWTTQDVHVAARAARPALAEWGSTATARGHLLIEGGSRAGFARARGWVALPASRMPVQRVQLRLNNLDVGDALLGSPVEHAPVGSHREQQCAQEFYVEGPMPQLDPGTHVLGAIVEDAKGERQCFALTSFDRDALVV